LSFEQIQSLVFQPSCVSCHGIAGGNVHGINLETYSNVIKNLAKVLEQVVVLKKMPPEGPLSDDLQKTLAAWIKAGAPEEGQNPVPIPIPVPIPVPSPIAPPTSLQPTFASISQNIFIPRCILCHGASGPVSRININDFNFLADPKNNLVIHGNAKLSRLFEVISATDNSRMPPAGDPLKTDEINTIEIWINNGAKD
jgi:mono/diheme cytochrome c family protein